MNKLYYGDSLDIMQREIAPGSVDLIYLDPPFNSNRGYHAIYKDAAGRPLPVRAKAFTDTWRLDDDTERVLKRLPERMDKSGMGREAVEFWIHWAKALRQTKKNMLAYLAYMLERILAMRIVLHPTGSIYLHCDHSASHYLKVLMDQVWGEEHFQNEFIWHYGGGGASRKRWARKHDVLLFYSKSSKWTFNCGGGRGRAGGSARDPELENAPFDDVWKHHGLMPWAKENLGYATQKPLALLERIIEASSNPGDLVLDPFCGCATTLHAAHNLGRRWVGVDISAYAVRKVSESRLKGMLRLKEGKDFTVEGIPRDMDGARGLWKKDARRFKQWAIERVEGIVTHEMSVDGIDGRIYYTDPTGKDGAARSMMVEVQGGGHVGMDAVRAMRGVLDHDSADMAGLVVMEIGGRQKENFLAEMARAGKIEIMGRKYPRMQLLTVEEILNGGKFDTPNIATSPNPQRVIEMDTD